MSQPNIMVLTRTISIYLTMETLTQQTLPFLETDGGSAVRIYAVNKLFIAQATSPRAANKVFCNFSLQLNHVVYLS